jgi:hypothetical protein
VIQCDIFRVGVNETMFPHFDSYVFRTRSFIHCSPGYMIYVDVYAGARTHGNEKMNKHPELDIFPHGHGISGGARIFG